MDGHADDGGATIGGLGELGLVAAVAARARTSSLVLLGPGDDAAHVRVPTGSVLVSTDVLVEGRHFRRDWSEARDVGRRAAAASLADVAAMGGVATSLVVGLGAPGDLSTDWALDLTDGLVEEAALVGAALVGGDVTAADQVVVSVTVLGEAPGRVVRRDGASPGDVVAYAGRLGWAGAGLAVLARGFRSPRAVVEAYRRPEPPYAEGPRAAAAGATSLIDVSDGLLSDLGHVARASGVGIDLEPTAFELAEPLVAVGSALGIEPLGLVLTGGDDHALAGTFAAGAVPAGWRRIGVVTEPGADETLPPVTLDGRAFEGSQGHEHFR